jgi:hypothetical protein
MFTNLRPPLVDIGESFLENIFSILGIEADYLRRFEKCLLIFTEPEGELHLILVAHPFISIP